MQTPVLRPSVPNHFLQTGLAVLIAGLLAMSTAPNRASAQGQQRPEAQGTDVESPEAIVEALYESVSAPAGEKRNWSRFRSLFLPEARLIATHRRDGRAVRTTRTVEEFIEALGTDPLEEAFSEVELGAEQQRFGDIAHVFSAYQQRRGPDAEAYDRGINSFQLWSDGDRWWIAALMWHEDGPIPERYQD